MDYLEMNSRMARDNKKELNTQHNPTHQQSIHPPRK
jgi:hypothetical protein